ncbi:MAG: HAD family hydrolase [Thermodesulfobacteriota bacterium]
MKGVQAVIFDCDGVLFDTARANRAYYNRIRSHGGLPEMTQEEFAYAHMHTVDEVLSRFFPNPRDLDTARSFRNTLSYARFFKYMEMEPHLMALLEKLRPRYKTAIATNRSDTMVPLMAEFALDSLFDLVVTSLDVERPKPEPDELLRVLAHFDLAADQAVYVGDSPLDEMAARAASIPFVAFQNRSLTAEHHIDTLQEMERLLEL